jgi:two-component system, cell cycle sensor histidine kinase and response regulator CckA
MNGDPSSGRALRVLLIVDDARNLRFLKERLKEVTGGCLEIEGVDSTERLAESGARTKYDFVLSDCLTEAAREPGFEGPLIDLKGGADELGVRTAIESAACAFERKCGPQRCLALAILAAIERYRKEKQRQSAEEILRKLRRTVEQSPDPVMICDRSGVLEYVNPAFEKLTGYRREEVIGQTLGILKSEQESGELYEEMWNTVLSGKPFNGSVVNRKKNGESFVLEKTITPLRNPEGEITHFISTGRDITDERRLQSDLQQAQKMEAIGRLAGGVAHDFNNLLMVISGYGELIREELSPEHALHGKVCEIISASRRAADLTRQLLAFGRRQMQSLRLLDLNRVLVEVRQMLTRLIGEDIQCIFVQGKELGRIQADPVQIEQIVMNLAVNARDAMPRGGQLKIETRNVELDETYTHRHPMVTSGSYVLLQVTDTGVGIAKEHLAHIFEPFYTTKGEDKGTGLGLATVYGIVKQNGGFIWVYSEPGFGTTFKVYLPRATGEATESERLPPDRNVPRGTETVLLVEDEAAVRECAREFLGGQGYTVLEAGNGEDALRVSRAYCGPIDLMISDVVMPKMSGPQLAEQLAAERPKMKILFASGYAESTVIRHGKIDATNQFIEKPFSLHALARKIREILGPLQVRAQTASS